MNDITFYGATWCADCRRSKSYLDSKGVTYNFIDIDTVEGAADKVSEINNGYKTIPTLVFSDASILVEPSNKELEAKLAAMNLLP